MQVRVKKGSIGFYGLHRRRAGEVFFIDSEEQFSKRWMEKVEPDKVEAKVEEPKKRGDSSKGKSGKSAGDRQVI